MRTPLAVLAGSLVLGGCITSPAVVYVPVPADSTVAAPVPVATPPEYVEETFPPVGISLVRAEGSELLLTTNQPAYVAVFEIVPNRGVTLVYPTSARRPDVELTGSRWVSVRWMADRPGYRDEQRGSRTSRVADRGHSPVRYVYTLASARPLRLTAHTFDDEYLRDLLGGRTFRAADPYETMNALAGHFVPRQDDEDWGEDLLTIDMGRSREPVHVTRVYCPDGSVTYVRDDLAQRPWCLTRGRGAGPITSRIPRPDSVVASNGRRIPRRESPSEGQPIFRVPRLPYVPGTGIGRDTTEDDGDGRGNNGDRGNHGNGNNGNNGDRGNHGNGNNGNASGNNGDRGNHGNGNNGNANGNNGDRGNHGNGNNGNANGNSGRPRGLPLPRPQGTPRTPQADSAAAPVDSAIVRQHVIPERERPDSAVVRRTVIPERERPQAAVPGRRVIPTSPRPDSQRVAPRDSGDSNAAKPDPKPTRKPAPKPKPSDGAAKDSSARGNTPATPQT